MGTVDGGLHFSPGTLTIDHVDGRLTDDEPADIADAVVALRKELIMERTITSASNKEVERLLREKDQYDDTIKAMNETMTTQQDTIAKQADTINQLNAALAERTAVIRILGRML